MVHLAEAVLFANETFYAAFAQGDFRAMAALWAEERPVTCLHPGWEPLQGRDQVLASWQAILRQPPKLRCLAAQAVLMGEDAAYVLCYEAMRDTTLVATNIFVRQNKLWRMVHHQSGPTRAVPSQEDAPDRGRAN